MRNQDARTGGHGNQWMKAALAMRRGLPPVALLLLPLLLGAAGNAPTDVAARRGDVKLTVADVRDMIAHADPAIRAQVQSNPAALADFVRDRVLRQTLLEEARAVHWEQNPDVIAKIKEARDTVIAQTYVVSKVPADPNFPTEAEIASAYEANKARFTIPQQYHLAQIAIVVPAGASKDVDDAARRKAQTLRQEALKPKADFAELARKESQDRTSADRGGDMGWVREDALVPTVRDAVAGLAENGISEPARSSESWHVVKLLGTRPGGVLPLDQVRGSLIQALQQARTQQMARAYVQDLLRKEPIQLNEHDLAQTVSATH
jgi:peptidylprolyl isomerase